MSIFPEKTIKEVLDRITPNAILSAINYRTDTMQEMKGSIKCFCPIHQEQVFRTLIINTKDKTYRCSYSLCPGNKGGDLISLYAKAFKLDYDDALSKIVQTLDLNIELPSSQEFITKTIEVAENYLELGELADAENYFRKIIKAQPNHLRSNLGLMEIYKKRNDEENYVELLKYVIDLLFEEKNFKDALPFIEEYLQKFPESLDYRRKLIDCYSELNMVEQCYGEYMNLADLYEMNNEFDSAIEIYRKLETFDIEIIDVYSHIINILIAADRISEAIDEAIRRVGIDRESGNIEKALETLDPVLELDASRTDLKHLYIDLCLELGTDRKQIEKCLNIIAMFIISDADADAINALQKINNLAKENPEVISKLAEVYLKQGNENEALSTWLELSDIFLRKDNFKMSIETLNKILNIQTNYMPALIRLSDILIKTDDRTNAIRTINKIVEIKRSEGWFTEAAEYFSKAVELDPENIENLEKQIEIDIEANDQETAYKRSLKLAEILISKEDKIKAVEKYKFALGLKPDVTDVRVMLADLLSEVSDFDDAKLEYFITAEEYRAQGKPAKAIAQIKKILDKDTEDIDALQSIGEIYIELQDTTKAIQTFRELSQKLKEANNVEKAEKALVKILELQPEDMPTLNELVTIYKDAENNEKLFGIYDKLTDLYNKKGAYGKVADICNEILKIDPENIQAHKTLIQNAEITGKIPNAIKIQFKLAEIYESKGDIEGQKECYQYILEKKPDNSAAREKLILLLHALGDKDSAFSELDKLIAHYSEEEKYDKPIALIRTLLETDPDTADLHLKLVNIFKSSGKNEELIAQTLSLITLYQKLGHNKEVIKHYKNLLQIDKSNVAYRTNLIETLLILERTEEAIEEYTILAKTYVNNDSYGDAEKTYLEILNLDNFKEEIHEDLIKLYVNHSEYVKATAQSLKLAKILKEVNKINEAITTLENVFIYDPDNVEISKELIIIFKELEDVEKVLANYKKIFDVYINNKKTEEAISTQKQAIEYQPESPELRKTLINAYISSSQQKEAVEELFSLAEMFKNKNDFSKAIDTYSEVVAVDDKNIRARKLKAELFNKTGNVQAALEEFMALSAIYEQGGGVYAEKIRTEDERVIQALPLCKDYKFDNFVIGGNNNFAHATALAVARKPAAAYNPLFLYSDVGLGKTHLMHAIANFIIDNHQSLRILYTNTEEFTTELVNAIQENNLTAFREKHKNTDILLIDDVQFLSGKERAQEEFFHIFNTLFQAQKQIVITSDRPPKDITRLEKRLISRFGAGVIVDIQPPDYETRIAILKQELAEYDYLSISDAIVNIIAEKMETNIRELKGALNQVIAVNQITGEDITPDMVKRVINNLYEKV